MNNSMCDDAFKAKERELKLAYANGELSLEEIKEIESIPRWDWNLNKDFELYYDRSIQDLIMAINRTEVSEYEIELKKILQRNEKQEYMSNELYEEMGRLLISNITQNYDGIEGFLNLIYPFLDNLNAVSAILNRMSICEPEFIEIYGTSFSEAKVEEIEEWLEADYRVMAKDMEYKILCNENFRSYL